MGLSFEERLERDKQIDRCFKADVLIIKRLLQQLATPFNLQCSQSEAVSLDGRGYLHPGRNKMCPICTLFSSFLFPPRNMASVPPFCDHDNLQSWSVKANTSYQTWKSVVNDMTANSLVSTSLLANLPNCLPKKISLMSTNFISLSFFN